MTTRDLGESGTTLIGVYFAASSVVGILRVVATFLLPSVEGLPSAGELALMSVLPLTGSLAVAAACLFGGKPLAKRLFSEQPFRVGDVSREVLLNVGLALLGVSCIAASAPGLVEFAGRAVWYAEGSRQSLFLPAMEQSWQTLTNQVLDLLVGGVLVANAGRLAATLDARYSAPHERVDPSDSQA